MSKSESRGILFIGRYFSSRIVEYSTLTTITLAGSAHAQLADNMAIFLRFPGCIGFPLPYHAAEGMPDTTEHHDSHQYRIGWEKMKYHASQGNNNVPVA